MYFSEHYVLNRMQVGEEVICRRLDLVAFEKKCLARCKQLRDIKHRQFKRVCANALLLAAEFDRTTQEDAKAQQKAEETVNRSREITVLDKAKKNERDPTPKTIIDEKSCDSGDDSNREKRTFASEYQEDLVWQVSVSNKLPPTKAQKSKVAKLHDTIAGENELNRQAVQDDEKKSAIKPMPKKDKVHKLKPKLATKYEVEPRGVNPTSTEKSLFAAVVSPDKVGPSELSSNSEAEDNAPLVKDKGHVKKGKKKSSQTSKNATLDSFRDSESVHAPGTDQAKVISEKGDSRQTKSNLFDRLSKKMQERIMIKSPLNMEESSKEVQSKSKKRKRVKAHENDMEKPKKAKKKATGAKPSETKIVEPLHAQASNGEVNLPKEKKQRVTTESVEELPASRTLKPKLATKYEADVPGVFATSTKKSLFASFVNRSKSSVPSVDPIVNMGDDDDAPLTTKGGKKAVWTKLPKVQAKKPPQKPQKAVVPRAAPEETSTQDKPFSASSDSFPKPSLFASFINQSKMSIPQLKRPNAS